ncbi:MAG TPA: glycosyltransferase family 2 protein [Vicinamibacterales bacterium]|nr:glycosyltransferase family 2 protein [Vicinamibacterales bacterium]
MTGRQPSVSIIVPCRNEAAFITDCLDSVLAMEYPHDRVEILIVDGMSDDGTRDIVAEYARRYEGVEMLDNPAKTTPAALNRGIRRATGELIVRLDAHSVYQRDYLTRSIDALRESGADCVGGVWVTAIRDDNWFASAVRLTLTHPFGVGNARYRLGASKPCWVDAVPYGCFHRDVFEKNGLYNEALDRSQDLDMWSRIRENGGRILLDPRIESTYRARGRMMDVWRYNFGNGVWVTWPMRLVGTRFRVRHLVPLAFVSALLIGGLVGFVWATAWRLTAFVAAAYLGVAVSVSLVQAARDRDLPLVLTGPLAFAVLHVSYGLGSLWGLVKPMRRRDRARVAAVTTAQ